MGYPLTLSLRYMTSRKGAFISVGTLFAIVGVALGVAALATVLSVTGGFKSEFRDKVLGVNAHVLVLKYSTDFREYRDVMNEVKDVPGVIGVAPFIINPMMVSHGDKTATGVLLKGVDPVRMQSVLDLPRHIKAPGSLEGLRRVGAAPPPRAAAAKAFEPLPKTAPKASLEEGERDDAGRNVALLRAIERTIAEERSIERGPGGEPPEALATQEPDEAPAAVPPGAPRGSIEPEGGYKSQLPDDDALADLVVDPCRSPELVAKMPGIVFGVTLARNLDAKLGDCVQVTSPTIGYTYSRGSMKPAVAKQFRLIAVFEAGFDQYDAKLVYTDLYEAQGFYDQGDTVTGVEMKVADIDKARAIAGVIEKKLANGLYHTMDWAELNHGLFTALLIQQIAMGLMIGLIIVVAAFTVVATLIMVVLDKKREIAVLKAMGATDDAILRSFIYQGAAIGLIGTAIGLVLGFAVCKGLLVYAFPLDPKVYFISRLPVDAKPFWFFVTGVGAIAICLVFTIFPALYAARLRPAEGMRAQ